MNDTSQMGITIAGVAVVSAIAAVAFNKLNVEPRLSRASSYERDFDDYPDNGVQDEGVDPPDRPWSLKNTGKRQYDIEPRRPEPSAPPRPSFQDDFEEEPERPEPSAPPRPSFQYDFEELEPERPEPSAPPRPSFQDDFQTPSESSIGYESQNSPVPFSVPNAPTGQPESPTVQQGQQGQQGQQVQQGQQEQGAMIGGRRHTRCKHCHSRLKYTRRK